jgi:predicted aspartyl protease
LPEDVFRVLLRTETVKREDIIGVERFSIADGSVIEKPVFILKQLKVGNITVTNIKASVGNMDSELLLGQSFQKKFKKIRVDNSDKTLNIEEY